MKTGTKIKISVKYLFAHFKRYIFLIFAVVFSFTVITVMSSVFEGMYRNVYNSAKNHYGGELIVLGFHKESGNMGIIDNEDEIIKAAGRAGIEYKTLVRRSSLFADGILYYKGSSSRQKNVFGVDFENESEYFENLELLEGSLENISDEESILISDAAAKMLNASAGDKIVLKGRTLKGQINTLPFKIAGIFRERSIFGYYKCFINRNALNRLLGFNEGSVSTIGFVFENPQSALKAAGPLHYELTGSGINTAPLLKDKNDYKLQLERKWSGSRCFVMTLPLFVSQIDELLSAMRYISYFVYLAVSLIILVSISGTYRIVIRERTGEIATMKAVGFRKSDIYQLFLIEAVILFLVSLTAGFILSFILFKVINFIPFEEIPGFGIFLVKNSLTPLVSVKTAALNIFIMLVITFPSFFSAFKSGAETDLVKALSGSK